MPLFYRLLGLTAFIDEALQSIRLYHFVRLNWILVGVLLWYVADGAVQPARYFWPVPLLPDPPVVRILKITLSSLALGLLIICWFRRNAIFQPKSVVGPHAVASNVDEPSSSEPLDLRVTARLNRGAGNTIMLREFPVTWHIADSGTISIDTHVVEVGSPGFFAAPFDSSGMWSLTLPHESLRGGFEEGTLYYSVRARPGLRLRRAGEHTTAILTVRKASQLSTLRGIFDDLLVEAAAREFTFYDKLNAKINEPPPTSVPQPATGRNNPENETPWENLIDFSR